MTEDTQEETARRNFPILLGEGVAGGAATELTSVQLVLPFLYTTVGAPVFFAGLLVPVSTVAKRAAQLLAAPIVSAARSNKRLMALSTLSVAAAIALVSLTLNAVGVRSVGRIMVLAAGLTCIGGLMAIAIELSLISQSILCYAVVFVLVSLGAQGVKNGRTLYLLAMATDAERPYCIAVANVTIGVVAIAFGALLGALAGFKGVGWPIFALVVLNVYAALYTFKLRGESDMNNKPDPSRP